MVIRRRNNSRSEPVRSNDPLKESDRHHRVYQVVDLFEKRILQAEREEEEATVELMESSEARNDQGSFAFQRNKRGVIELNSRLSL